MEVVTLFCAIVRVKGSSFLLDINGGQSVAQLKKAIKAEKLYQFPADDLQLWFATKPNDLGTTEWLSDDDKAAEKLEEGRSIKLSNF